MGFWGMGLYQNDISLDVKDTFEKYFNEGKNQEDITEQMLIDFEPLMGNNCEEAIFWLALSDVQWNHGILHSYVKERALFWIDKNVDTAQWKCKKSVLQSQRKIIFDDLKRKLMSPQPPVKEKQNKKSNKCKWNIGDVYALRLESSLSKERGLGGQYLIIQKIDEIIWDTGDVEPIVYVKITRNKRIPINSDEYNQSQYVQTGFTRYEERFLPIDGRRPKEDIAEKSKIKYEVDEFGFLPKFRVIIPNNPKSESIKNLIYVGNFIHTIKPTKEFVPHAKFNIISIPWKQLSETFETRIIKLYFGHNHREFDIYSKANY